MPFTVNLSPASTQPVTVHYSTADGTATGGATCGGGVDYVTTTGTLTFAPSVTVQTINVPICGDKTVARDETFTVTLDTPVNALITPGTSTGTITNDDHAPVANNVTDSTTENTLKTITMSSTDADGDAQTFSIVGSPSHGSLGNFGAPSCTAGNWSETVDYTPTRGYTGTDSFTYKTNDGANDSNTATVSLTISFPTTLVVTKTADTTGTCIPGDCSLREAINAANSNSDQNTITLNIPAGDARDFYYRAAGSGSTNGHVTLANVTATTASDDTTIADIDPDWPHRWWSISPTSALPAIASQVTVDGYTQTGASVNTQDATDNAVIRIELNGVNAGANVHGLTVNGLSLIKGLVINRFSGNGIGLLNGSSAGSAFSTV